MNNKTMLLVLAAVGIYLVAKNFNTLKIGATNYLAPGNVNLFNQATVTGQTDATNNWYGSL